MWVGDLISRSGIGQKFSCRFMTFDENYGCDRWTVQGSGSLVFSISRSRPQQLFQGYPKASPGSAKRQSLMACRGNCLPNRSPHNANHFFFSIDVSILPPFLRMQDWWDPSVRICNVRFQRSSPNADFKLVSPHVKKKNTSMLILMWNRYKGEPGHPAEEPRHLNAMLIIY